MWVRFDSDIKQSYDSFLTTTFEINTRWIYSDEEQKNENEMKDLLPKSIHIESYRDLLGLWRVAMLPPTAKWPLPKTHNILVYGIKKRVHHFCLRCRHYLCGPEVFHKDTNSNPNGTIRSIPAYIFEQ